jgi:hypothetical protein
MTTVAPAVTAATSNETSYAPDADVQITLKYTPGASETTVTFTGTATDQTTGQPGSMQGTFNVLKADPTTTEVTDTDGRTYTKVSDDGTTAVFSTKA